MPHDINLTFQQHNHKLMKVTESALAPLIRVPLVRVDRVQSSLFKKQRTNRLAHDILIVPFPKLDGPWIGGNEDGASQEGGKWGIKDSGEQSLEQQHG